MKPNANSGSSANLSAAILMIAKNAPAKVVSHPRSKKTTDGSAAPPDEETLLRLNAMAKQYPFCILHRQNNNLL